ncbi:MAG: DUF4336 domain-containing protein, partial [Pseudomonadales bacterium]|nr:DUF4336 domain-containing protein [Pseudomonadales bacterium]
MTTGYEPLNTLKRLDKNIWIVDGPHIQFYGLPFPTRMTIVRLNNGELFIHSPIALTKALKREIEELGKVRHLVSPNWIHYASIASWQKEFDNTLAWASPNVEARARKYKVEIEFDRSLSEEAEVEWAGEIDQLIAHGSKTHVEVVFFHKSSKTLIITDLIENFEKKQFSWLTSKLLWLAGNLDPDGKAPIDMRLSFFGGK